jgi:hypothetical protein
VIALTTAVLTGLAAGLLPPPADTIPVGSLVTELRLGTVDGPHDTFTAIEDLEVSGNGDILVVDPRGDGVRVFSARGEYLRTVGGAGAGPGEFRLPFRIGMRTDTIWVHDLALRRLNLFKWPHQFLGTVPAIQAAGADNYPPQAPLAILADGSCLVHYTLSDRALAGDDNPTSILVRTDCGERTLGTVATLSRTNEILAIRQPDRPGGGIFSRQPLADQPLWAIEPGGTGIWIVNRRAADRAGRGTFQAIRLSATGDTLVSWTIDYLPLAVTAADRQRLMTEWVDRASEVPGLFENRREAARAVEQALYLPSFHPPVSALAVNRNGELWLRREASDPAGAVGWEIYSPRGELRARVSTPPGLNILRISGTRLWGAQKGDFDVPVVVRYRVEGLP